MGRREVDFGDADAIGVAGLCGAVDPSLRPGDVVLATELRSEDGDDHPVSGQHAPRRAAAADGASCHDGNAVHGLEDPAAATSVSRSATRA